MRIQTTTALLSALVLAAPAVAMTARHDMHVIHQHHPRLAKQLHSEQGDREVRALNRLEAAGYRNISAVVRHGAGFSLTADKQGKMYTVAINDAGKISAKQI